MLLSYVWWGVSWCLVILLVVALSSLVKKQKRAGKAEGGEEPEGAGAGEEGEGEQAWSQGGVRLRPCAPPGSEGEIKRILDARDHYAVIDVARDCEEAEIKKAFRAKQLATHPDKNQGAVGALEASQRVNAANDVLSDTVKRRQYDMQLAVEEKYGSSRRKGAGMGAAEAAAAKAAFSFFCQQTMGVPPKGAVYPSPDPADYDGYNPAPNHSFHMPCSCGFDHVARKVPRRTKQAARWCCCQSCRAHSFMGCMLFADHDDVWFETSSNLLRLVDPERFIKAYRCLGSFVYDITDWCRCNGMLMDSAGNPAPTHTHYVPFKLCGDGSNKRRDSSKKASSSYGFGEFKGKGNDSHKQHHGGSNKGSKGRRKGRR